MGRFDGRVALITGASRGIGAATAELFRREGATVVGCSRRGGDGLISADVTDSAQVKAMVDQVIADHGRIDVLVNNAGITRDTLTPAMEDAEWDEVLATNAGGAFKVARAVARPMMMARRGRIINVSSVAATRGGRGQANYAASKAALEGFTRALAVELAPRGIAVNAVAPGIIETEMTAFIREAGRDEALGKILMKRFGRAEEVAEVIAFLASDAASYITGAVIPVDGGFKMA